MIIKNGSACQQSTISVQGAFGFFGFWRGGDSLVLSSLSLGSYASCGRGFPALGHDVEFQRLILPPFDTEKGKNHLSGLFSAQITPNKLPVAARAHQVKSTLHHL